MSWLERDLNSNALVLFGRNTATASLLMLRLGVAIRRARIRRQPSSKPHMTMLCDTRAVEDHVVKPLCWAASEFVLVLSHMGRMRFE